MHIARIFWLFSAGFCATTLVFAGCSSSSNSASGASGDASAGDGAGDEKHDGSNNCVPPGTPNNELGLGGYCDEASDCPGALCTGLFGAPDGYWFCSKLCANGEPCGTGETCATDPARGTACVPNVCIMDAGAGDDGGD